MTDLNNSLIRTKKLLTLSAIIGLAANCEIGNIVDPAKTAMHKLLSLAHAQRVVIPRPRIACGRDTVVVVLVSN